MEVGINMNEPGMEGNSNSAAAADEAEAQAEAIPEPERPEEEPPAVEIHFYSQSMFAGVSNIWP